ncbi:LysR substrate-binding domain-containing protein [Glaciimonas sp. GG7]
MQDLNDLFFFANVVEQGGFTAAGRSLGIPKSRLSRRISELEARLGVRLLQRNTRGIALTDIGSRYYKHCQLVLAAAEAAEVAVTSSLAEPSGHVRVSCVVPIARDELALTLPVFLARYPRVSIELVLTNRRVNLLEDGIDIAVRVRTPEEEDPNLATRRLRHTEAYLVAAPALMQQFATPDHPRALTKFPFLGAISQDRRAHFPMVGPNNERHTLTVEPRLAVEDFTIRKHAALCGLGITMLPANYAEDAIASGELVRVLPNWALPSGSLQLVYLTQRGLLPAVRVFIDFLIENLSEHPANA